jgi:neutral ceramidase
LADLAAQTGMMGYAMSNQSTAGIHFRLRSRAFIISDGTKRVVFVSTDSAMIFTSVKREVVLALQRKYGDVYSHDNVMLSGTHTHAGPGGYSEYSMYLITTLGFTKGNWLTIIDGIVNSISIAHDNLKDGKILMNSGELLDSNLNRSPFSYLNNPADERAKYKHDVDKDMTLLRFEDMNGNEIGMVNWFPVHGVSMTNQNKLISGDNKGYASYAFEKYKNPNSLPGMGPFVAAFAQSNEGDVTPNTKGAFCDNGMPCDFAHSTCGGYSQGCHGYGPGKDQFENTKIIGGNQFKKAVELYESAKVQLNGPIQYIHTFVDMHNVVVQPAFTGLNEPVSTCLAALGDSFAGGTTDGPGDFNFKQGVNDSSTNAWWNFIAHFLSSPSTEQIKCQYPKPILLNTGGINLPAPWTPSILPLQIFRVGQFVIIGVPGEFTTMSGRRLRNTVQQVLSKHGLSDGIPVIAGLSNAYSHYIATHEEYVVQRYEGASTLFGPWTLAAYQQLYASLAEAMLTNTKIPPGPTPPNLYDRTFTFQLPVIEDAAPGPFGQVARDVLPAYTRGNSTVVVSFWGANPRNDYRTQDSFLTVENLQSDGSWKVVLVDGDWDTRMYWESSWIIESRITITWDIAPTTAPGKYRIRTFGKSKDLLGNLTPYVGTSSAFSVM